MASIGPREYASKYWNMEVPMINDDNEITKIEKINFKKYRLHQGWKDNIAPPGHAEFLQATTAYAYRLISKEKPVRLVVKNIWGGKNEIIVSTMDTFRKKIQVRAVQAFSGKGSPEDVQLTLQLVARCGLANNGLQRYCDETVDQYARLGLDCNGFVGNYLTYRNDTVKWSIEGPKRNLSETGIRTIVESFGTRPVTNVDDMLTPRMYVLGLVDGSGTVIDQYAPNGGVGHIMITEAVNSARKQSVYPPIPKEYLNDKHLWYMGVESTPAVGLSRIAYVILKINKYGVATVWRNEVKSLVNVKIYPVS
ncbi:MAG: hypothetical protein AB1757_06490 [Acidobacteriota bacterium]